MDSFNLCQPKTIKEALNELNANSKARLIAGGTDILIQLRKGLHCNQLVDVTGILDSIITEHEEHISIGGLTTHCDVIESKLVEKYAGVLKEACLSVAGPQIRNLGTIAGNIGNGSPAGDTLPALIVLGAQVVYQDQESEKVCPLEEFFVGPGKTKLEGKGIITSIRIPKMLQGGASFFKIGKRNAMAISVCNCAAYIRTDTQGEVAEARIALGSVAPTPYKARKAEAFLNGQLPTEDLFGKAGSIAASEVKPIDDLRSTAEYRQSVVEVLTKRALSEALKRVKNK